MNNVDNIEQLRENYYTAIKCLQNEKDIIEALPSLEYNSFFLIMTNLIDRLKKEQVDLQSMLQEANEDDMHVYIEEELKMCMLKISVCDRLYQEGLNIQNIEQESVYSKKHLIFAKTDTGNIYLEKDLKDISEEYYETVLECLNRIENNYQENNVEKARAFVNNPKLSGLHEMKEFKIRVIYKILTPDCVYIILSRMKKDNNALIDREAVLNRNKQIEKQYQRLKKDLLDENKKNEIINENELIKENIFNIINNSKRR